MSIIILLSQKFPTASLKFFNKKKNYFYLLYNFIKILRMLKIKLRVL